MKKTFAISSAILAVLLIAIMILLSFKLTFFSEVTATSTTTQQKNMSTYSISNIRISQGKLIKRSHYMPPPPVVTHATIASVGDVLIHSTVYHKAYIGHHQYNFLPMLKLIKADLERPDIITANSESKIGGQAYGLSSYPQFNSPFTIGNALKADGVDLVTMANNHILDRGTKTLKSAIKYWDNIGMPYTGAFLSKTDQQHIRTLTVNNITFAFLAYTYGTNGLPIPNDKPYLVNLINPIQMKKDIVQAKKVADVVVLSLHFGIEYQRMPNSAQKELVNILANDGADIIFGSHPHVLQPVSWVTRKDGSRTFVAYSLGNFISGQHDDYKNIGGIVSLGIEKTVQDGIVSIRLEQPSFIPTYVDKQFVVHPLSTMPNKGFLYSTICHHMNQWMSELKFPKG